MPNLSAARKATRAMRFAALVSVFAGLPLSAIAQQPANQSSGGQPNSSAGAAGVDIAVDGARKGIIFEFLDDILVAQYRYYWWHNGCYVRYQSGGYKTVALDACSFN